MCGPLVPRRNIINDKAKIWTQVECQRTRSNPPTILPTRLLIWSEDGRSPSQAFPGQSPWDSLLSLSCRFVVSACAHQEQSDNTYLWKDNRALKRKRRHEKEDLGAFHYWSSKVEF